MRAQWPLFIALLELACSGAPTPPSVNPPPPATDDGKAAVPLEEGEQPVAGRQPWLSGAITQARAEALVKEPSRSVADRKKDERRRPVETLLFLRPEPGQRAADLGAGDGYTTELLARALGEQGVVYGHNTPYSLEKYVGKSWPARLAEPTMKHVVRIDAQWEEALPAEARDLDLVTLFFSYHDVIAQEASTTKLNQAVLAALKPGGHYIVADHQAPETGEPCPLAAARERIEKKTKAPLQCVERTLHRIHRDRVIYEVEREGFQLVDEGSFLGDPSDDHSKASFDLGFETDRFLLKFKKVSETHARGSGGRIEGIAASLDDGSKLMTPYTDSGLDFCASYFVDLRGKKSPHRPPHMRMQCKKSWAAEDAAAAQ